MDPQNVSAAFPGLGETSFNPKHAVAWLEEQPHEELRLSRAEGIFEEMYEIATKPRLSSGHGCVKLCGYVEQCSKSANHTLRDFAFTEEIAIRLFEFYVEWSEQDAHKSMRLVLDFLISSISKNPMPRVGASIKARILNDAVSMITQQSTRPSIKSAMIALDHLVQKKLVYLSHISDAYQKVHSLPSDKEVTWDAFVANVFAWMELPNICPAAGKLLVTIFTAPWYEDKEVRHHPEAWHRFISKGLQTNSELLEPTKLYVFGPLFKDDRAETLRYLHDLSSLQRLAGEDSKGWDLNAMLWLAMLEAGKKIGVVDEPGRGPSSKATSSAHLPADILDIVLSHRSHEARSSGVSILVASPSTTRPYTAEALELLKRHLPSFHEDTNAKFRYDVLGHSRNMVKRLQGSVESLRRDFDRASRKAKKTGLDKGEQLPLPESSENGQTGKQTNPAEALFAQLHSAICHHEDFIRWYVGFLKGELLPTASYQRHITALKAMTFILKSTLPQDVSINTGSGNLLTDKTWFRLVLDLILDPFDDVREYAASLLMMTASKGVASEPPNELIGLHTIPLEELQEFCRKADELARKTARADHSDGVARSYELLCRWSANTEDAMRIPSTAISDLENKLSAAEKDLANAVLQAPVHGSFATIRYIWGSLYGRKHSQSELEILKGLQYRAIECCRRAWHTVRHVLCDDSPEGHLPEELEEVDGLDTKDLLSYSFRAIHESSQLLRVIGSNARHCSKPGLLAPSRHDFEAIGRLTFDELSNLRHRGAFSTVSQTFTSCCQLVKYYPAQSSSESGLLDEWYEGALSCIHTQASTTRRSAGIPALMVGILSASAEHPSFEEVMSELQEIARQSAYISETDGSNLPQVHALNCLKDIFKSSFLSSRAETYLTDCLQLAADSLKSEVWAIRNCGLLLLRSLIDNLFGTNESKASMEAGWDGRTIRIPYHKFKALPALLVNLLELGQESAGVLIGSQTAESVFPALDIIRRAGPPNAFREKLYGIIAWYLGSHIWHVREIAARTLCSFLLRSDWPGSIELLITNSGPSANKLHGALLTLKFLLERLLDVMPDQLSVLNLDTLSKFLEAIPTSNHCIGTCPEARAVYLEIISFVTKLDAFKACSMPEHGVDESTSMPEEDQQANHNAPVALLKIRLGDAAVQHALREPNEDARKHLNQRLKSALEDDINVSCTMVEAMSTSNPAQDEAARASLIDAYMQACLETNAPEPRTLALENLASMLDMSLSQATASDGLKHLPSDEDLFRLWTDQNQKPLNPSLSDAIVRVSGPIIATVVSRSGGKINASLAQWLRCWGAMISDAGTADRTFDSRMSAIKAIESLTTTLTFGRTTTKRPDPAHLPWLLALYDALNDDDDEIREAAASAVAPVLGLGQALVSVEAGSRLLRWLASQYGHLDQFRSHVASRMVGQQHADPDHHHYHGDGARGSDSSSSSHWVPVEAQLASAMRFDDALFVVEEQNLYVDEVREAWRWRGAWEGLPGSATRQTPTPDACTDADAATATTTKPLLSTWILAGLQTLTRLAEADDGPLGWTSKPQVFAICARTVIGAAALATAAHGGGDDDTIATEIAAALQRFRDVGRGRNVHGLLLAMCGLD